ncbi:MAG: TonB-dependent receptor [Pyrinomonadaceae bacterium]|nr:TonB-dependent receptor [Pyrinomonadaceae bacterium]
MLTKTAFFNLFCLILCGLITVQTTFAQATDNGGLNGTVTDQQQAIIPNATVTVTNIGTNAKRTVTSNNEGRWNIPVLPLGEYEVVAELAGFDAARQNVTVVASTTTSVDLILGIAGASATVNVTLDNESLINSTDSATVTSGITGRQLEQTPVANRTAFGRIQLDTSASGDIADPLTNGNGNPEVSINGGRTNSQSLIFNGIDATNASGTGSLTENISPAPETVQEVKLLSSLYDASLGRSGGGSVQVVTRGGTNNFNGTAYLFAQNEAFNANDFFFNRDGIDRQKARRFEGGVTVGGRIIKDKLFFFGGYQKTDASTAYVPTAQSFVVLPEALAFITNRSSAENVRLAFQRSNLQGGTAQIFNNASCIRTSPIVVGVTNRSDIINTCIDPFSVGFRLLSLRNPVTNGFLIPDIGSGSFERLFANNNNVTLFDGQNRPITDLARFGFPNGLPLIDRRFGSGIAGGVPLVRVRNVFPAEFKQDQFTTRFDYNISQGNAEGKNINTLNATFFFANFPGLDPFSDDTLVSATPLVRNDRNRTLAVTDTHYFNSSLINEARFGYFTLDNSRELDSRFLSGELTNAGQGIFNPTSAFAPGPETQRLARFAGTGNLSDFSIGAPNDVFNRRKQTTLTFADNVTYVKGKNSFRFGVEAKRNFFDTNLPEEQGGEFEGLINFNQILTSFVSEADTAFGITDKQFRFNDLSFYATDEIRLNNRLTFSLGLRWDWFSTPTEKNGRFANFDFDKVTDFNDIRPGFVLPNNSVDTGFQAIDASLPSIARANNKNTLNGQDLNNFAPRIGFAYKPFNNENTIVRGGYGIFYDRPSAAFINTIYSNYPFFREIEVSDEFAPFATQAQTAFSEQNPNTPFSNYLPLRIIYSNAQGSSPYVLYDNTPGVRVGGVFDVSRGQLATGNQAEPLEFRAVDRNLKTPLIQQFNIGIQQNFGKNWVVEARYVGSRGQNLLLAVGFNQPYDLNDPNTPDYIFQRFNDVYERVNPGSLRAGATARERGRGIAFGSCNRAFLGVAGYAPCSSGDSGNGGFDLNLDPNVSPSGTDIIPAELRTPYLGFDPTDAVTLQSRGYSIYHSGQVNLTRRFDKGFGFNASYTYSNSIDIGSTDPGSTTASGRPDTANLGLVVQGDQRNLNANRALSDFDRRHRFSASSVFELPSFGSKYLKGFTLSGFGQIQSGTPFSIFASNADFFPQVGGGAFQDQFLGQIAVVGRRNDPLNPGGIISFREVAYNVGAGSGTIYNAAFGRPSVRNLESLRRQGSDPTREYFNTRQNPNDPDAALFSPLGGFGNLGRNILRGPSQKRIDISLQKSTRITERISLELKWDIFNVFNFVNFANPNSDLSDETDFGQITRTVGSPRVMQFGAKLRF